MSFSCGADGPFHESSELEESYIYMIFIWLHMIHKHCLFGKRYKPEQLSEMYR